MEVVLAIGVVSFALLTIIGLFGGVIKTSADNLQRREIAEAVDSLRAFLNEEAGFTNAYNWARNNASLLYVTYKSDPNLLPDPNSKKVVGKWTNTTTGLEAIDAARSGRWVRARLSVSPSNPGGSTLPDISTFTNRALIFVTADFETLAQPGQTNSNPSMLQTTISVSR